MQQTRVAVIGCGRIATSGHLPAFHRAAQTGLCRLVGVCDVDRARAEAAAEPYALPAFTSVEELLHGLRPDVVSIATPPASHAPLVLRALTAGCHVLCEKPVAMTLGEATAMVRAAEREGRLLSICFQYRYWDEAAYLRRRIAAGDLGHIYAVRTWGGASRSFPASPSFHRRSIAGGGVLSHWTIHNLDLALWLLGYPEPLTASAFTFQRLARSPAGSIISDGVVLRSAAIDPQIEDFAMGFMRLAGDTVLTVEANYLQPPSSRPEGFAFLGDRGAASLAPLQVWIDNGREWIDDTPIAGTLGPCDYGMDRLMADFLERIHTQQAAPVSGSEIICIQALMDALYRSASVGHEVTTS